MRKFVLLTLSMVMLSLQLLAQNRTIKGRILDEKGTPVANATVVVTGTTIGTVSNSNGEFSISVPANARSLTISGVGYSEQELRLGTDNEVAISLKVDNSTLEGVVITGYTREKKSQFAGAATTLGAKVIENKPVGAFDQALQGRVPGLLINSGSGQPGASANINIRGIHSITGAFAQPLIVVDGIPMAAGDVQTINPNDFESLTVLKDASAAALYGARGGLGVIVITTKSGKVGQTTFGYRGQYGVTNPPNWNQFDMMNTKEILQYEERLKLANNPGWHYSKNNPEYNVLKPGYTSIAQQQSRYDFMLDSIGKIDMFYPDALFRKGITRSHEINVNSGTEKTKLFLSAGMFNQEGTDLSSELRRYTVRFNIDHTVDKLSISFRNTAGYSITNYSEGEFLGNSARNSFQMAWRAKPYENPYRSDGSLIYGANTTLALKQIGNVLEGIENSLWRQNQIKLNSGLTLAYRILPNLTLKNTLGVDVSDDRWQRSIKPASYVGSLQAFGNSGINSEAYELTAQLINTTAALYNKRFGVHEVDAGAYFEVVKGYGKGLGFTLYNLDPRLTETGQGAGPILTNGAITYPQNATSAKSEFGIRSYFGTARYTYNNRYTITGNIRRDGTSRIANEENQNITTWSSSVVWNAMNENFMKSQGIFTDLRVRASYGSVPNIGSISTSTYAAGGGLVNVTNYLGPQQPSFGTTSYAGSTITGLAPTTPGNPNLKIETIKKFNIGADFNFWDNRLRFVVDAYHEKTVDLFVSNALPATSGFGSGFTIPINAGVMTNKGLELTGAVDVIKTRDMDLTFGINHAINKNKIEDLGAVKEIPQGTFIIREGLPYGSHYATNYLGADPATGRPVFETEDGKTTTDPAKAFLFAKFGTYTPKHSGGFHTDFRYKRFSISALFSYQFDVQRYNNIENWVTRGIGGYHSAVNASKRLLTMQWQKPGDNAYFQSPSFDRGFSSSDIQDAKFLRFRNLSVAYQIPELNIGNTRLVKGARFYIEGHNLMIWSPWRGPDPEDSNNISLNEFPNSRAIVAGIDITF